MDRLGVAPNSEKITASLSRAKTKAERGDTLHLD
tara:strand:- start:162 stop:263 length:102 start_codon:yes stop_codon:yes gene_type:complete